MASKRTVWEWEHTLKMLRECPSKISGMDELVFSKLRFSFDSLCTENTNLVSCTVASSMRISIYQLKTYLALDW